MPECRLGLIVQARHAAGRAPGRSQAGPHPLGGSPAVLRGRGARLPCPADM